MRDQGGRRQKLGDAPDAALGGILGVAYGNNRGIVVNVFSTSHQIVDVANAIVSIPPYDGFLIRIVHQFHPTDLEICVWQIFSWRTVSRDAMQRWYSRSTRLPGGLVGVKLKVGGASSGALISLT